MKVGIAADHAGIHFIKALSDYIKQKGFDAVPIGPAVPFDDYPDTAEALATALLEKKIERGILICGSGVGVSVAANKFPGIRAAVCHDSYSAHQGVEHDNMNIICLGARIIGIELAKELADKFLHATFSGEERHVRRSGKIDAIENKFLKKEI
ncbi:MAG TPA: RpiB/LacA/LacB family sugar-phosphate isomerase [Bacteroidales bacterium]|nr:RpiB/LacA/LacB family sugar-phosphate isomerase [Bacteroidales bacterium]